MYVYKNRRYEEEIGMLKCHREGEQRWYTFKLLLNDPVTDE
jgi:hypothetical protein